MVSAAAVLVALQLLFQLADPIGPFEQAERWLEAA